MTGALERKEDGRLVINNQVIDFYIAGLYGFCRKPEEAAFLTAAIKGAAESELGKFAGAMHGGKGGGA